MSHNLTIRADGSAELAYAATIPGGIPWHGFGQIILPTDTLEEIAAKGGWDTWHVDQVPVLYRWNDPANPVDDVNSRALLTAPASFVNVRSDNGLVLGVVGNRTKNVQPFDAITFYRDFILQDPRFVMETIGTLKGGKIIWCQARYNATLKAAGEPHVLRVLFMTSFDGTYATRVMGVETATVCNNTLDMASMEGDRDKAFIRIPHSQDFSDPFIQQHAFAAFKGVLTQSAKYQAMADALVSVKISAPDLEAFFKSLTIDKGVRALEAKQAQLANDDTQNFKIIEPSTKARNALEKLLASYRDTLAEGRERNTAWAALNAVTRYVDHGRSVRDTQGDGVMGARFSASLLGSGAALKREALQVLADIGGLQLAALGINVSTDPSEGPTRGEPETEGAGHHDFASLVAAR